VRAAELILLLRKTLARLQEPQPRPQMASA